MNHGRGTGVAVSNVCTSNRLGSAKFANLVLWIESPNGSTMKNDTLKTLMALLAGLGFFLAAGISLTAVGNETIVEKIESKLDESGRDLRRSGRKMKRQTRNATGHGSLGKDVRDAGKDAGDEIRDGATKLKRKAD